MLISIVAKATINLRTSIRKMSLESWSLDVTEEAFHVQCCSIPVILLVAQRRHALESVPSVSQTDGHSVFWIKYCDKQFWQSKVMSTSAPEVGPRPDDSKHSGTLEKVWFNRHRCSEAIDHGSYAILVTSVREQDLGSSCVWFPKQELSAYDMDDPRHSWQTAVWFP